ncbi:hypothetical protein PybrP1_012107 [[Pythium] brassicae (nom. inval.)]|nr:hypothetical protein PybrP1_012107 [[Pythium] brassicae (nom. inval.)]
MSMKPQGVDRDNHLSCLRSRSSARVGCTSIKVRAENHEARLHLNTKLRIRSPLHVKERRSASAERADRGGWLRAATQEHRGDAIHNQHCQACCGYSKKFDLFLSSRGGAPKTMSTLVADDVDEQLMGTFASFLVQDPTIGFSASTTYLSSVKRQLEELTRTDFFRTRKNWYASLRGTLRKSRADLSKNAPLMTVEDLVVLTETLFARNDTRALKDRTLLAFQWTLIGRSSDVGDLDFHRLQWTGEFLLARVSRKKTRQEHTVAIFPTALIWQYDPLHALAAQAAVDSYGLSTSLFSQVEGGGQGSVSAYINRLLVSLAQGREGADLTSNLRSHSSRRGAAAVAASSADVDLSDLAHRGRWSMEGFNTLMEYISATSSSDQKVARVLGGWHSPARKVAPPGSITTPERLQAIRLC